MSTLTIASMLDLFVSINRSGKKYYKGQKKLLLDLPDDDILIRRTGGQSLRSPGNRRNCVPMPTVDRSRAAIYIPNANILIRAPGSQARDARGFPGDACHGTFVREQVNGLTCCHIPDMSSHITAARG